MYPPYGIRNLSVSKYMEKKYVGPLELRLIRLLTVDSQGSRVTSDIGLLLAAALFGSLRAAADEGDRLLHSVPLAWVTEP